MVGNNKSRSGGAGRIAVYDKYANDNALDAQNRGRGAAASTSFVATLSGGEDGSSSRIIKRSHSLDPTVLFISSQVALG